MRDLSRGINQAQENLRRLVITHKPIMSSRQLKRRKSSKDMVTSLMESSENVKRKSKPLQTHSITSKWETRTTEINSSKELRVPTLKRSRFLKTSAEPLQKLFSRREESFRNCTRTTMTMPELSWRSEQSLKLTKNRTSQLICKRNVSTKILTLRCKNTKELSNHTVQVLTTSNR